MNKNKNLHNFFVNRIKYLSCCTSEIMQPKTCGKTIQNFPQIPIDSVTPKQQKQINDVRMNS